MQCNQIAKKCQAELTNCLMRQHKYFCVFRLPLRNDTEAA
ncbi:hypothetical protein GCWU000324_02989 [Kingella oralis ATCC 51147]|uniref:Uncharacterized protein n=1 Tax=Kingella oralis ATCC 51147 TaxID=629741 RepID=C4GMQ3_9NEIS|nr:hypothetical protein GCWU000324_02989 [Kingella oralis ATCC 51147]